MGESIEIELYNTIKNDSDPTTVNDLIQRGVDCNLPLYDIPTKTFICPIQLAADNDRHSLLRLLYEHRNSPTKDQLEKHLTYYIINRDQSNKQKNETLFEYTVSHLFYFYITEHKTKKIFDTFIAALHNFNDVTHRGQDLCGGSRLEIFLALRIHTLFQKIIDKKINKENHMIEIIEKELLHNLEMYYFLIGILFIPVTITKRMMSRSFSKIKSEQPLLIEYYQCIAKNLINKKIKKLKIDEEYTIPTHWIGHAVCVSFRRITQTHIIIRIDNPSPQNLLDMHEIERSINGYNRIKPKVLGQLHVNNLDENVDDYFVLLIDSVRRDLTLDEGISLFYNLDQNIHHLEEIQIENLPNFDEQANANCFVKCFEPGIRIRIGETHREFYDQLLLWEQNNANALAIRCKAEQQHSLRNIFGQFTLLAQQLPIAQGTSLKNILKTSYKQHYQYLSSNINIETPLPINEKYIHSRFKHNNTLIELKDILISSRVLMLGDAGCGKTTACQYITYAWADGKLWEDQFDWLFYIKMRNLNSEFYPEEPNNCSLINIIERECFKEYELSPEKKQELEHLFENPSKILWILDGCDEGVIPDHLLSIKQELLDKPCLLLTSRPYATDGLQYDTQVQIESFTNEDISKYIKMYFSYTLPTIGSECWSFVRYSIRNCFHLQELARIPACLEIMCGLWKSDKGKFESKMTMGQLYEQMCEYILRRYIFKFHVQCSLALTERDNYPEPNAIAFLYLEQLAFQATKFDRFTISGREITTIAGFLFLSVLRIGLLVSEGQKYSSILDENIYYFIHPTFQEYLCARYMVRILESSVSNEQKNEVFQFIKCEKYNRRIRETFRLFFELERSTSCTDQFWSVVDSEPRDLVGLRHYSRIAHWFPNGICEFSSEDQEKIDQRVKKAILAWISNRNRHPHDVANAYLFETFASITGHQCWIDAWKEDLFIQDPSKRRYFLSALWSEENIQVLIEKYDQISENIQALYGLIKTGPNKHSLKSLEPQSNLFTLYKIDDQTQESDFFIKIQKKAIQSESITTLDEFRELLDKYDSFAKLNRQLIANGSIIEKLKIAPSALENINDDTLRRLLELSDRDALFFRYFKIPVIPFLRLYAKQNYLGNNVFCSLIVSITISSSSILTAPPAQNKLIRVYEKDSIVDIEMEENHWSELIEAFRKARIGYGYSDFF